MPGGAARPWVEKYRPREIADVVGNDEAVARLRVIAEEGNFPNMLLAGEPPASRVYPHRPEGGEVARPSTGGRPDRKTKTNQEIRAGSDPSPKRFPRLSSAHTWRIPISKNRNSFFCSLEISSGGA